MNPAMCPTSVCCDGKGTALKDDVLVTSGGRVLVRAH